MRILGRRYGDEWFPNFYSSKKVVDRFVRLSQPINAASAEENLQPEIIPYIARFIMSSPRPSIAVEFQGGEPFLNFCADSNQQQAV